MSSADWMPRNLYNRVEIAIPVAGSLIPRIKEECLEYYLKDNCFAWELQPDGNYKRLSKRDSRSAGSADTSKEKVRWFSAQQKLIKSLGHPELQED